MIRHALSLLFLASLLLVGCSGSSTSTSGDASAPLPGAPEFGGKNDALAPEPLPVGGDGSSLIVTSSLVMIVDDLEASIDVARETVRKLGGVLVGISRGSDGGMPIYREDGSVAAVGEGPASLTFRLPADLLEPTIDALRSLGEVTGERIDASDVSGSLRDLEARLKNLRAAEANYQRLLERAENVADLLAVTAQLDLVRGEIERLAAEQAYLSDAVARSTLSLVLYPPATPVESAVERFDLRAVVDEALAALVSLAIAVVTVGIYGVVLGLPLLAILYLLYRTVGRRILGRSSERSRPRR